MDYLKLDKVRRIDDTAAARRRRGVRPGPAEPARIHPARHDRRPVARLDQRRHRGVRRVDPERGPVRRRQRTGRRPVPARALRRPLPVARSASPSSGPSRSTRSRCRTWAATASPPSASSSCARSTQGGSDIAPGLAESWEPNADGTVWTFKLRQGVKWQDGTDFSSADVVATMERLVAAGNSGLKGVLEPGGAVATDANTVTFNLAGGNGNFPYLVSVFNAQTLITPVDYPAGTTLDAKPNGTGAWKLKSYNQATGASFERNPDWWGGATPLDGTEFIFFDETGPMVTAYQGGQVDAIVQFDVLSGKALFDDTNFSIIATSAALHRQIWMRTDKGPFADKRVRQALALTFDRPALIQQLFQGKAELGNDHVIWQGYPYFDPSVAQRTQDIDKAKALLADAGATGLTRDAACRRAPRDPGPRGPAPEPGRPGRDHPDPGGREPQHVLRGAVVPRGTRRSAVLRRRGPGHRRLRPPGDPGRLPQRRPQVQGHLELVPVQLAGLRPGLHGLPDRRRRRRPEDRVHQDRDHPQRRGPDRPAVLLQLPRRQREHLLGCLLQRPWPDVLLGRVQERLARTDQVEPSSIEPREAGVFHGLA